MNKAWKWIAIILTIIAVLWGINVWLLGDIVGDLIYKRGYYVARFSSIQEMQNSLGKTMVLENQDDYETFYYCSVPEDAVVTDVVAYTRRKGGGCEPIRYRLSNYWYQYKTQLSGENAVLYTKINISCHPYSYFEEYYIGEYEIAEKTCQIYDRDSIYHIAFKLDDNMTASCSLQKIQIVEEQETEAISMRMEELSETMKRIIDSTYQI